MGKLVTPKVYLIGYTTLHMGGMEQYLRASGNEDFLASIEAARQEDLSDGEILTSFYAKLCYASLTLGKNENITRVRDIPGNLVGTLEQAHGSVWEHCWVNFVCTNCSRVLTHELVRHRAGTAFSQTSGRYVRSDRLDIISDPILAEHGILTDGEALEAQSHLERLMLRMGERIAAKEGLDMDTKKRLTSAVRRWLPNGQANEIGFSLNLRSVRHTVMMRTGQQAEWEIRLAFEQVYKMLKEKYPLLFYGAKEEMVRGITEVSGMKMQPYERNA
jgi:thymidylate synthase (FAD)